MNRKILIWFSRQPVIFKACLENQKAYSVNCTGKFVFGFQDDLCSLGLLENQIVPFWYNAFFGTQIGTLKIIDKLVNCR